MRQHGVHYLVLSEHEVVELTIPEDATINPNVGGKRALVFVQKLKTRGGQENHDLKFTCFSNDIQPGARVVGMLKLGNRQVKGNRKMTMYVRLDVGEHEPTVTLTTLDSQEAFLKALDTPGAQDYRFPRDSQPGGVVLTPIPRDLPAH